MTECLLIKPVYLASSGGGTNVWIKHEGVTYYSRINGLIQDSPGQRNLQIHAFLERRKAYVRNAGRS